MVHTWSWRCRVFRSRVPKDLLALVGRREEKASLGTKDVGEAKRRHAAHAAQVEARWANLRAGVRQLDFLEVNAVAGEVYDDLIAKFQVGRFSPVFNLATTEPLRVCRRLQLLRGRSHDEAQHSLFA